jgi:hypothetical protein
MNAPRVRKSRSAGQLILPSFIIGQGPRTTNDSKVSPRGSDPLSPKKNMAKYRKARDVNENDGKNSYLDSPENNDSDDSSRNQQPKSPRLLKSFQEQNIVSGKALVGMLHTRPGTHENTYSDSLSSPRKNTKSPLKLGSTPKKNLMKNKKETFSSSRTTDNSQEHLDDRNLMASEKDYDNSDDAQSDEETDPIERGIQLFNKDWKEGIAYLTSNNLIEDHTGVASFLHAHLDKLSKSQLGEILAGKEDDTNVLKAFTHSMLILRTNIKQTIPEYYQQVMPPSYSLILLSSSILPFIIQLFRIKIR